MGKFEKKKQNIQTIEDFFEKMKKYPEHLDGLALEVLIRDLVREEVGTIQTKQDQL